MPTNSNTWNELRNKLWLDYPKLADTDLQYTKGEEQKMLRMIEYKLGVTKQEMKKIIEQL